MDLAEIGNRKKKGINMILEIKNIECFAHHGCLPEENSIGQKFSVDVDLEIQNEKSVESDELGDTADYVLIHKLVRKEMSIKSNLIEHVAGRILQQIKENVAQAQTTTVKVTKYNPPVNGQIEKVAVIVKG